MEYKNDCGFRKHLKVCKFKPEKCKPPKDGEDYNESCHFYDMPWDVKKLKQEGKDIFVEIKELESKLKEYKKTDKEKYRQTKDRMKDLFYGGVCVANAIRWIKRTGNLNLNKQETRIADKLMNKVKDGKNR